MRGLVGLLQDEADSVNLSAMSALRMLSESRDGCDLLLDAEAIVGFVGCLSEMKRQPILLGEALFSLGNLTKLAESIKQAMAAGAVDRLMALLAEGEEVSGVQMQALVLKCVWNIANLDEGKVAIIEASGTGAGLRIGGETRERSSCAARLADRTTSWLSSSSSEYSSIVSATGSVRTAGECASSTHAADGAGAT